MANLAFTTAFLLVLISSYGIISTEQRLLKISESSDAIKKHEMSVHISGNDMINSHRSVLEDENIHEPSASAGDHVEHFDVNIDDFRPTVPGHSPGAGHSNGPRSQAPN